MSDLTKEYPRTTRPYRKGVYLRDFNGRAYYSYWDGAIWGYAAVDPNRAFRLRGARSRHQDLPWRGLASDPNKK